MPLVRGIAATSRRAMASCSHLRLLARRVGDPVADGARAGGAQQQHRQGREQQAGQGRAAPRKCRRVHNAGTLPRGKRALGGRGPLNAVQGAAPGKARVEGGSL